MAIILDALVGKFFEKCGDLVQEHAMMLICVKEDFRQLQKRLNSIKLVIDDAESKRIGCKAIDDWVKQLKEVLYDADDLIEYYIIEGADLIPSSSTSSMRRCISFFSCSSTLLVRIKIALKIRSINDSLNGISKRQTEFHFIEKTNVHAFGIGNRNERETDGLKDPNVVGVQITNAINKLVGMMFKEQDKHNCLVFAICGMGGIGKTTLAQCIFNDNRIASKTKKIWLCISQVCDNIKILRQLIRGVGGDPGSATERAELLLILEKEVDGKDIFLVLDDVWPSQEGVWNDLLRKTMQRQQGEGGPSCCRVLLTSRFDNVARKMDVILHDRIHRVDELSEASGWELLCKLVSANGEESDIDRLKDVGLEIVKKCKGLPLAIKVISVALKTKDLNVTEWKNFLSSHDWFISEDSELPKQLKEELYLSYEELPSNLKQCFLYLSMFPKDFVYDKSDIVRHWVAEGFILSQRNNSIEEIAEGYYEDLIRRNIIQVHSEGKMHDIVRFFGQHLSKDESYFYGGECKFKFKVRRIWLDNMNENASNLQQIHKKSLRTLFCFAKQRFEIDDVIVKFSYLRVLSLARSGIQSLPESIGDLVHLRLLNLRGTKISVLPNSISRLKYLQSLDVSLCEDLSALPKEITQLCNLRHLVTEDTNLTHLPKGIGSLKKLNELSEFIVGNRGGRTDDKEEGCSLEELRSLSQLRKIRVTNLSRTKVTNDSSALLVNHSHLTLLELYFSPSVNSMEEVPTLGEEEKESKKAFEVLMPPPSLKELIIHGCTKVSKLPPLGQLPYLESLHISGAESVIRIGLEFLGVPQTGGSMLAFPKLKKLTFEDMRNWEEWEEFDEQIISTSSSIAPCLTSLTLRKCEKLRALPNWLSHSIIRHLDIWELNSLKSISNLPHLERLTIKDCSALTRVEGLESLRTIELDTSYEMERLPMWLSGPIKQRVEGSPYHDLVLELKLCREELMMNCCEGGLHWPIIQLFPRCLPRRREEV